MKLPRLMSWVVVVGLLVLVASLDAGTQAKIKGRVTNLQGEPIAGATVTLTTTELSNYRKTLTTDADGEFTALILDATRTYDLSVEADGFRPQERGFKVGAGTTDGFFAFKLETSAEAAAAATLQDITEPGYRELFEGKELLRAGDEQAARTKFEEAVAANPELIEALSRIAELAYTAGDMSDALNAAKRCLAQAPESQQCLAIAINASQEVGDEEARAAYMARYQELNPDDPTLLFNEAAAFLNNLDDEQARPLLERCLGADPDFPECNFEYGMLLLRQGDMEGAKRHLLKYLEVAPTGSMASTAEETIKYL